ncbi:UMP-CMP kinase-like [Actinia tenebrosa]|uniref:UMP-CMP kinase n=1 Tax=Actinia tenebrosa TaxID=6105 RepID=A0A6P8I6Z7_ACTTE|nr:UMP-CMP kinase-like [Actinia tenebrosa]
MFHFSYFVADISLYAKRLMSATAKPIVIFVLGGPGAGKGTQCEKIVQEYGYNHLSAGELLREERASGSKDGDLIESCMTDGKIVPVEITIRLLQKAMDKSPIKKFLIDGFPRNEDNLQGWEREMKGKVDLKAVFVFQVPEDVCIKRILDRGKSSGRSDDNIDSLRKRFQTHRNSTIPIIEYYKKLGLVRTISGLGSPDEVFQTVKEVFKTLGQ